MTDTPVNIAYLRGQVEHFESLFAECQRARDSAGYLGSVPECIQTMHNELTDAYRAIDTIWAALDGVTTGALDGADLDDAIYAAVELVPPTMRGDRPLPPKKWRGEYTQEMTEQFTRAQWEGPEPKDQFEDLLG